MLFGINSSGGSIIFQGAQTVRGGLPTYYFAKFLHENERTWTKWVGDPRPWRPVGSATEQLNNRVFRVGESTRFLASLLAVNGTKCTLCPVITAWCTEGRPGLQSEIPDSKWRYAIYYSVIRLVTRAARPAISRDNAFWIEYILKSVFFMHKDLHCTWNCFLRSGKQSINVRYVGHLIFCFVFSRAL